jgi:hypothetical protein
VQTQSTLFDEDTQVLRQSKPPDNDRSGFERIGPNLHRLFEQWEGTRSRRARLEAGMTGPYDADLSLCLDGSLAAEESVAVEIAATLFMAEVHHE